MQQPNRDPSLAEKASNAGSEKLDALPEWWYYLTTDQLTDPGKPSINQNGKSTFKSGVQALLPHGSSAPEN